MLYAIFITLLILSAILGYSLYRSRMSDIPKLLALPVLLLLATLMGYHYVEELGKPDPGFPADFTYVHHVTEGDTTYLWAFTEEKGHKLYLFPYDQENEKKLEEAKQKTQQGVEVKGDFKETQEGENGVPQFFESPKGEIDSNERFRKS